MTEPEQTNLNYLSSEDKIDVKELLLQSQPQTLFKHDN